MLSVAGIVVVDQHPRVVAAGKHRVRRIEGCFLLGTAWRAVHHGSKRGCLRPGCGSGIGTFLVSGGKLGMGSEWMQVCGMHSEVMGLSKKAS